MFDKIWETHHEIMEDIGSDVDTRDNLLVYERLLQLVRLLVAFLDGELLDLSQLARERLVLTAALSEAKQKLYIWFSNQVVFNICTICSPGLLSCLGSHQGGHVHC